MNELLDVNFADEWSAWEPDTPNTTRMLVIHSDR
jgi:hypothetical protein